MKNSINNKLLIIFIISIIFIICFSTICFASTTVDITDMNNNTHNFIINNELSSFKYLIVANCIMGSFNQIQIFGSDFELCFNAEKPQQLYPLDISLRNENTKIYRYTSDYLRNSSDYVSEVEKIKTISTSDFIEISLPSSGIYNTGYENYKDFIVYSNYDIYDTSGELVFQGAPQVTEITKILMEQTEKVGMTPLGLVKIILPIVTITIVGLIGFWKAWHFLLKQLKKS